MWRQQVTGEGYHKRPWLASCMVGAIDHLRDASRYPGTLLIG
jgi:hypothetical protein